MKLEECLQMDFFTQEGFTRQKCPHCSSYFWSYPSEQKTCGDSPCTDYTFIGNPLGKKRGLSEMRTQFLSFFKKEGHTPLQRYPVVARWRDDIYLTIASIADFQPHVTSGLVPPPANPLVISQPSIRLNDLESVGRSGRHLTLFEMMGHHAFNNHEWLYWTEETTEYCHRFLQGIGIPAEKVTYKEAEWFGGGNAGPCLEVLVDGLELATLVFMTLEEKKNGPYRIHGLRYDEMPLKVVDTGYGLERLVWITQGSPSIYDAIFPRVNQRLIKDLGIIPNNDLISASSRLASLNLPGDPLDNLEKHLQAQKMSLTPQDRDMLTHMEHIYTLSDHARCLVFLLGDGIVPSNAGAGYLARLIIRRALRLLSYLHSSYGLQDLVEFHREDLIKDFPDLSQTSDRITEILEIETRKYRDTLERGKRLIQRWGKEKKEVTPNDLVTLYDTHGLSPETVKQFAGDTLKVSIPPHFDSKIAEKHQQSSREAHQDLDVPSLDTRSLFYDKPDDKTFDATVLWKKKYGDGYHVILDQTLFYPEGGGQPSDTGYIKGTHNKKVKVQNVYKTNGGIVHVTTEDLPLGTVHGEINWRRRHQIMRHHTAVHIINAAARTILGDHIWQTGSQVGDTEARLDITHYKHVSIGEQQKIEILANKVIHDDIPVNRGWMERNTAEKHHGFQLYQGGAPKGNRLRIIEIPGFEVEACGGTHVAHTGDIGIIKITGIEHLQDGVERLRFSAGESALTYIQGQEQLLREASGILNVEPKQLPRTVKRFFAEWKTYKKELDRLRDTTAGEKTTFLIKKGEKIGDITFIHSIEDLDMKSMISLAGQLIQQPNIVIALGNKNGQLVLARSPDIDLDCGQLMRDAARILGGSGGGRPDMAQGGGPHTKKITGALNHLHDVIQKQMG